MKIKSSQTLVEEAEKNIETLSAKQTKEIINSKNGQNNRQKFQDLNFLYIFPFATDLKNTCAYPP